MSGGKSRGSEKVTQVQEVPPEIKRALNFLTGSSMGLAAQYGYGPNGANYSRPSRPDLGDQPGGRVPFNFGGGFGNPNGGPTGGANGGGFSPTVNIAPPPPGTVGDMDYLKHLNGATSNPDFSGSYFDDPTNSPVINGAYSLPPGALSGLAAQSPQSIVPNLSTDTLNALGMLRGAFDNNPAVTELTKMGTGQYSNPYTGSAEVLQNPTNLMNPNANVGASVGTNSVNTMNPNADYRAPVQMNGTDLNNASAGMVNASAGGVNDYAMQPTDLSGVTDQITSAAKLAVGDRFAAAGRSGSGNEGLELGRTVARELAPYAFNARENDASRRFTAGESSLARRTAADESRINRLTGAEDARIARGYEGAENFIDRNLAADEARFGRLYSAGQDSTRMNYEGAENFIDRQLGADERRADRLYGAGENAAQRGYEGYENYIDRNLSSDQSALARGFSGYEADRARQLQALSPLLNLPMQQAQNYLNVGQILEEQQRRESLEPFELLGLLTDPLVAAISGAPRSTTTSGRSRSGFLGFQGLFGL